MEMEKQKQSTEEDLHIDKKQKEITEEDLHIDKKQKTENQQDEAAKAPRSLKKPRKNKQKLEKVEYNLGFSSGNILLCPPICCHLYPNIYDAQGDKDFKNWILEEQHKRVVAMKNLRRW
ncbi:uncharacterized protein [Nicotiana tomentosiformis]|uniref:uncharacterized protein n=1 Tax=Nicotiana tomentosiformis TaxID=4098 RepID=UPI00388CABB5